MRVSKNQVHLAWTQIIGSLIQGLQRSNPPCIETSKPCGRRNLLSTSRISTERLEIQGSMWHVRVLQALSLSKTRGFSPHLRQEAAQTLKQPGLSQSPIGCLVDVVFECIHHCRVLRNYEYHDTYSYYSSSIMYRLCRHGCSLLEARQSIIYLNLKMIPVLI